MGQTDRLYDWATGANIEDAKIRFQKCIEGQEAMAAFGSGNPDLGGIGVILSLSILCITCTISTLAVLILGLIRGDHKRDTLHNPAPDPKSLFDRIVFRVNESIMSALKNFLDSALYLSLTVQIATLVWSKKFDPDDYAGRTGGFIYDLILLMYTPIITICPVLTLINSPFFRKRIRRRHFRLLITTGSMGYALYFDIIATGIYKYFAPLIYNHGEEYGCMPEFLVAILPAKVEAKLLYTSWAMCMVALIFTFVLEWEKDNFRSLLCLKFIKKEKSTVQAKEDENNSPSDSGKKCPSKPSPRKLLILRVIWGLYFFVWIWNQFLPLYLLWRIRWMRRNIRSAVHDYIEQVGKDLGPVRKAQVAAVETWDNDEWTFGQVLSMSLWFPALLEMFYSMITGDERALTGTLPRPWKATMVSPNETVIEIDNNDPIEPNVRLTIIEPETKQPEVRPELAASA